MGDITLNGSTPNIETGWQTATCSYDKTKASSCDANTSIACCTHIKGGTWLNSGKCEIGETVGTTTGDTTEDQANCESLGVNYMWDFANNVCRAKVPYDYIPLPADILDGITNGTGAWINGTQYCNSAYAADYDDAKKACKVSTAT